MTIITNFRSKILDADIDEFISNLSPDTSDMSDDSGPFQSSHSVRVANATK